MTSKLEEEFAGIKFKKRRFQKLEKEILRDYHKTHEFTRPKENNSVAVYDYNKIKEKFAILPEISEERIAEKLRKMKKRNEIKRDVICYSSIFTILGFLGYLAIGGIASWVNINDRYNRELSRALSEYADINKDSIITKEEKNSFFYKLINKSGGIIYEEDIPSGMTWGIDSENILNFARDKTGKQVSRKELKKWIEKYEE